MGKGAVEITSQSPPAAEASPRAIPAPLAPAYDVRRKRPPALSFLLRWETLRTAVRVVSLAALDYLGLFAAVLTALGLKAALRTHEPLGAVLGDTRHLAALAYLVMVLLFGRSHLYADRPSRPGLTRIVACLFQVTLVVLIYALANDQRFSSYYIFYASLFFAVVYVSGLRAVHLRLSGLLLGWAGYRRRTLLVGSARQVQAVAHALRDGGGSGIDVVGALTLDVATADGLPTLGGVVDLGQVLGAQRVQEVIVADPDFPEDRAVELVDACHQRGVTVYAAPSTMEVLIHRAAFVPGQSVPLFVLKPLVFDGIDYVVKRAFDIVVSSLLLLALSPFLLAIAAAIKLGSRGSILYRSVRPGIGGAPFACLKFRTMHDDAERSQAHLEAFNEASGALFKIRTDPRLTRVGQALRRFSLDELPQLVNVLRGQMSLVGPRPLPTRDYERLDDWHKKRYLVLPGMTGLWQVSGRAELDFDDLVRLDFVYLERWSIFLDLVILLKTIPAVLSRRGAF